MTRLALVAALAVMACGGATAPDGGSPPGSGPPNGSPSPPAIGTEPGRLYEGTNGFVEFTAGELPVIVSAPHGGDLAPNELLDRTAARCPADDDFSATNDLNTLTLARLVADSLAAATGKRAHLVVSRLARRKLDANRDSTAGSCGDLASARAWHEYHTFLDTARAAVARRWPRGLYIDLHGHAHAIPRIELGYLLRGADLDRSDAALDATSSFEWSSSIHMLSEASPLSFATLLRGPTSLGAMLAQRGYPAVPSPADPGPSGAPYFTGGYDTERHGCRDGGVVCGVQAELPLDGVRGTDADRQRFAGVLARVLVEYVRTHLGISL